VSSPLTVRESRIYTAILLDIEGTTTPVDFVYQTLFPYASRNLEPFLREHFVESEIKLLIQQLHIQHNIDEQRGLKPPSWVDENDEMLLHSSIEYSRWLIARDSKYTALKSLQGRIWQEGYARGELHGQVYSDVPPAFKRWRLQNRDICIYSSGSVIAQQLLFSSITSGDLTPQITAFFDTRIGPKTEIKSYRRIAYSLLRKPNDFVFVSDTVKEVEAAQNSGMHAILCIRSRDVDPIIVSTHLVKEVKIIHSFDEIFPTSF
jgi:enolase-phosphatase E1